MPEFQPRPTSRRAILVASDLLGRVSKGVSKGGGISKKKKKYVDGKRAVKKAFQETDLVLRSLWMATTPCATTYRPQITEQLYAGVKKIH